MNSESTLTDLAVSFSKRLQRACSIVLFVALPGIVLAQVPLTIQNYRNEPRGDYSAQRMGVLDGNHIRTLYFNTTEITYWPQGFAGEWPTGSGHNYIDGCAVLIGAKVHLNGDTVITPIESHYREEYDFDPNLGPQFAWDLEPVPGYSASSSTAPAISSIPTSWPSAWSISLDLSQGYNGHWYSQFGVGPQPNLTESFFVVDDSRDAEFTRAPYRYYPIGGDTTRGGLGLRVEVRSLQWSVNGFDDILFWIYRLTNISDHDYDTTSFGFYIDPGVGSYQNSTPANSIGVDTSLATAYYWAESGMGYPDNWRTGYVGLTFLETPEQKGLSSAKSWIMGDKGPTGVWPKNDNVVWSVMNGGIAPSTFAENANIASLVATGPFHFPKWSSDTVITAFVFANDLPSLKAKRALAAELVKHEFQMPTKLSDLSAFSVILKSPAQGSTVSGTVPVTWETTGNVGRTVTYVFCQRQDEEWIPVGIDSTNSKQVTWNTAEVRDGIFYGLRLVCTAENGSGFAEIDSTIIVNNPVAAMPEVILDEPLASQPLSGGISLGWRAGDADGDPTFVNLSYMSPPILGRWVSIAENIPASADGYSWNTREAPNGSMLVRAVPISGADTGTAAVMSVSVFNERIIPSQDRFNIVRGSNGTGPFAVHVVEPTKLTGSRYMVTFGDLPVSNDLSYDIKDLEAGQELLSGVAVADTSTEGPEFDGVRLILSSDSVSIVDTATHWQPGTSNLSMGVAPDALSISRDWKSPSDYDFVWFSETVDSTIFSAPPRFPKLMLPFRVTNLTENTAVKIVIDDADLSGSISVGDSVRFVEHYVSSSDFKFTWTVTLGKPGVDTAVFPMAGDRFMIRTRKPFLPGDSILFSTDNVLAIGDHASRRPSRDALLQNYPNPFNPSTRIRFELASRSRVSIKVFDLLGREVMTLVNEEQSAGPHEVELNARTLATGVYFYTMRVGTFSQTKKLLLMR